MQRSQEPSPHAVLDRASAEPQRCELLPDNNIVLLRRDSEHEPIHMEKWHVDAASNDICH